MKARHIRRILFFLMVLTAVLLLCSPAQAADNISAGSFRSEDGKTANPMCVEKCPMHAITLEEAES